MLTPVKYRNMSMKWLDGHYKAKRVLLQDRSSTVSAYRTL
jgi:hypothetical protein